MKFVCALLIISTPLAAANEWTSPCLAAANSDSPFCDSTLDYDSRVADLLSKLTIEDKITKGDSLLSNDGKEIPHLALNKYQWWSEALHGVAESPGVTFVGTVTAATSFPQPLHSSQSFNRTLFATLGAAISTEARAMNSVAQSGLTYWTPNLNIFRDPRWGRGQETPGEDPYLTSEYVLAYVPALEHSASSPFLKISACCKHYAAYSLEAYDDVDRHNFNANVTDVDFADTYLPAFKSCAGKDKAAASSMMCSYNAINGVPSCANGEILNKLAREKWGFEGYITSDCGAVDDVYSPHDYSPTPAETIRDVLTATMDSDCGGFITEHMEDAYNDGTVSEELIDAALTNLLKVQFRLGMFEKEKPFADITPANSVDTYQHRQLALEAARQGMTLLKNEHNVLPLKKDSVHVGLVGPHAQSTNDLQGNYFGVAPFLVSPEGGLQEFSTVTTSRGCDINSDDTTGFDDAVKVVSKVDTVVLAVGINQDIEAEGLDRYSISLPGMQADFVEAILTEAAAQEKPVVLVYIGGGGSCLGMYSADPRVSSIVAAGYSGQSGGTALAETMFGEVGFSGRLTHTYHRGDYVNETDFLDMNMRSDDKSLGRTYRFYRGDAIVYPFGTGLSLTDFEYKVDKVDGLTVELEVTNVGNSVSDHTVLAFVKSQDESVIMNPIKSLKGFDRVANLTPGKSETMKFQFAKEDFGVYDEDGEWVQGVGEWVIAFDKGNGETLEVKMAV